MRSSLIPLVVALVCVASIQAQESTSDQVNEERAATYKILDSRAADFGDHKVIFHRIEPPAIPNAAAPLAPSLTDAQATAELRAVLEARATKRHVFHALFAEAQDMGITELRWNHAGQECRALTTMDMSLLPVTPAFETEDTAYSYFIVSSVAPDPPSQPDRSVDTQAADFHPISGGLPRDTAFDAVRALHDYYNDNRGRLQVAKQEREAARAERERLASQPAPPKEDTVIYYWPITNSNRLRADE
jgi:hypothetical protein